MTQVFIGTSGWAYPNWKSTFYPKDLPSARFLEYYAKRFSTAEINYSFYHLPKAATYEKWVSQVRTGFIFSVKASRLITHTKRLRGVKEPWRVFLQNAQSLGPCLGPILFQFPASFRCDHARLGKFLKMARTVGPGTDRLRLVFEFRHESWFVDEVYRQLSCHGAALCIADSCKYPRREVMTADFVYFRFHGRTQLFTSNYTRAELAEEAKNMRRFLREGRDVYAYFNNDAKGYAISNARKLTDMMRALERVRHRGLE
jgi:uncharacterized protein YecE (DUF72 family)